MIKHNLKVPCDSFEENCAHTRTFSSTPFYMRETHFLVYEIKEVVTSVFLYFLHIFNCNHNIYLRSSYSTWRITVKSPPVFSHHGHIPSSSFATRTYPIPSVHCTCVLFITKIKLKLMITPYVYLSYISFLSVKMWET